MMNKHRVLEKFLDIGENCSESIRYKLYLDSNITNSYFHKISKEKRDDKIIMLNSMFFFGHFMNLIYNLFKPNIYSENLKMIFISATIIDVFFLILYLVLKKELNKKAILYFRFIFYFFITIFSFLGINNFLKTDSNYISYYLTTINFDLDLNNNTSHSFLEFNKNFSKNNLKILESTFFEFNYFNCESKLNDEKLEGYSSTDTLSQFILNFNYTKNNLDKDIYQTKDDFFKKLDFYTNNFNICKKQLNFSSTLNLTKFYYFVILSHMWVKIAFFPIFNLNENQNKSQNTKENKNRFLNFIFIKFGYHITGIIFINIFHCILLYILIHDNLTLEFPIFELFFCLIMSIFNVNLFKIEENLKKKILINKIKFHQFYEYCEYLLGGIKGIHVCYFENSFLTLNGHASHKLVNLDKKNSNFNNTISKKSNINKSQNYYNHGLKEDFENNSNLEEFFNILQPVFLEKNYKSFESFNNLSKILEKIKSDSQVNFMIPLNKFRENFEIYPNFNLLGIFKLKEQKIKSLPYKNINEDLNILFQPNLNDQLDKSNNLNNSNDFINIKNDKTNNKSLSDLNLQNSSNNFINLRRVDLLNYNKNNFKVRYEKNENNKFNTKIKNLDIKNIDKNFDNNINTIRNKNDLMINEKSDIFIHNQDSLHNFKEKCYEIYIRNFNKNVIDIILYEKLDNFENKKNLNEKLIIKDEKKNDSMKVMESFNLNVLGKIAHEFKTPISSIIGLIENIRESLDNKNFTQIKKELNLIKNLSNYTLFLINDFIQFYNKENDNGLNINFESISLNEILKFCYSILKTLIKCNLQKQLSIRPILEFDEEALNKFEIKSDNIRLRQILLNFISNAVKFTKTGFIVIEAKLDKNNENIMISIIDSGIGIRESDKDKLFKDNSMLKITEKNINNKMGSGLGLSICKSLAEKIGHKIEFESNYQKGSCFKVIIKCNHYKNNEIKKPNTYPQFQNLSISTYKSSFIKEQNLKKSITLFNKKDRIKTLKEVLIRERKIIPTKNKDFEASENGISEIENLKYCKNYSIEEKDNSKKSKISSFDSIENISENSEEAYKLDSTNRGQHTIEINPKKLLKENLQIDNQTFNLDLINKEKQIQIRNDIKSLNVRKKNQSENLNIFYNNNYLNDYNLNIKINEKNSNEVENLLDSQKFNNLNISKTNIFNNIEDNRKFISKSSQKNSKLTSKYNINSRLDKKFSFKSANFLVSKSQQKNNYLKILNNPKNESKFINTKNLNFKLNEKYNNSNQENNSLKKNKIYKTNKQKIISNSDKISIKKCDYYKNNLLEDPENNRKIKDNLFNKQINLSNSSPKNSLSNKMDTSINITRVNSQIDYEGLNLIDLSKLNLENKNTNQSKATNKFISEESKDSFKGPYQKLNLKRSDINSVYTKYLSKGNCDGKILIIDDNQYIRSSLKKILVSIMKEKTKKFEIIEGYDGADIIKQVIDNQTSQVKIKCIFTDENMEYIHGSEAIKIIRNLERDNKISTNIFISITSFEDEINKSNILKAGADMILFKPYSKNQVMKMLSKFKLL